MDFFTYEFVVCNKIFENKGGYLRTVNDSIPGVLSLELYLDDKVNILSVKSNLRVEAEIFRVVKGLGINIKFLYPRLLNNGDEVSNTG